MSRTALLRRLAGAAVLGSLLVAPATASADATQCAPGAGLSWARVQLFADANCGGGQMAIKADDRTPDRANFAAFRNWDGKTYNVDNSRSSLILAGGTCVRLYDGTNFGGQASTNICATSGRLDWNLNRFDNRTTSIKVCTTSTPDACGPGGSPPPPGPAPQPRPEPVAPTALPGGAVPSGSRYVALGDSYSSGVGTRDYDLNRPCMRGTKAWPALVDTMLETRMTFRACGGAVTEDVLENQVSSLTRSTRLVTITIGGNDAGFSGILIKCGLPWPATCWGEIRRAERFVRDDLGRRLDRVYNAIRRRSPRALVVVANYPRIFAEGNECNAAVRISTGEQRRLNAATDLLSDVIRRRVVRRANFRFADVRGAFAGHSVCSAEEWLNGLANGYKESFHPNVAGSRGYADVVVATVRR